MSYQHLTTSQIQALIHSKSPVTPEVAAQRDHIVSCDQCRDALVNTPEFDMMAQSLARDLFPPHLTYADQKAYIKGTLDDAQHGQIKHHIEMCAWCMARVDHLQDVIEESKVLEQETAAV